MTDADDGSYLTDHRRAYKDTYGGSGSGSGAAQGQRAPPHRGGHQGNRGGYDARGRGRGREAFLPFPPGVDPAAYNGGYYEQQPAGQYVTAEGVLFARVLRGHTAKVTALVYDLEVKQLYSGSADKTVRVWDCEKGTCGNVVDVGGPVDALLLAGGFLFVAVTGLLGPQDKRGVIRVWNTATSAEHQLEGHAGAVFALAVAQQMLFSCGQDATIRAWKLNGERFEAAGVVTAQQGGHSAAVKCLVAHGSLMFSADFEGTIKVWDVASSGQCLQTLHKAHSGVVLGLLPWQDFLLSCSLDGTLRVWQVLETPGPSAVLAPQPVHTHPPDAKMAEEWGGVLAMAGGTDARQRPILMTSYNADGQVRRALRAKGGHHAQVRLWELPTFQERGVLSGVTDARCLVAAGPGGYLVSGDLNGIVKVWRWDPAAAAPA